MSLTNTHHGVEALTRSKSDELYFRRKESIYERSDNL